MRDAIKFFAENAGYCTPPGRMACAKSLAEAEAMANELDLVVRWEFEEYIADYSWCDAKTLKDVERGAIEVLCASVSDAHGEVLASLGGIFVHVDDRTYRRVVEAELLSEAIQSLKVGV